MTENPFVTQLQSNEQWGDLPGITDVAPYPHDGLPGSEYVPEWDGADAAADHDTLWLRLLAGENVDGMLFRLRGWPGGKVRRARPVRTSPSRVAIMALCRGQVVLYLPHNCVVYAAGEVAQ